MTYTPPLGNAANFSFEGLSAYTAPDGAAANFSWFPSDAVYIKRWNGTTWDEGLLRRWSGTHWGTVTEPQLITHAGRAWVLPPA